MELSKNNLLSVSVYEGVLQQNFALIESWFNSLRNEISQLKADNILIHKQLSEQPLTKMSRKNSRISSLNNERKSISIEKGNESEGELKEYERKDKIKSRQKTQIQEQQNRILNQIGNQKDKTHHHLKTQDKENERHQTDGDEINKLAMKRSSEDKRSAFKAECEQMMAQLKTRVFALEKDSEKKEELYDTLNDQLFSIKKTLGLTGKSKKGKQAQTKKTIKESQFKSKRDIQKQESQCNSTLKQIAHQKSEGDKNQNADKKSENGEGEGNAFRGIIQINNELQRLKDFITAKTRSIQANLTQNQMKVQNIERNIDMLERSQQILKFDIEKNNTQGNSKTNRGPQSKQNQEGRQNTRGDQQLNQTRVTNKQYYEERLVELFNEMDFIKQEYLDLMSRIDGDDKEEIKGQEGVNKDRRIRIGERLKSHGDQEKSKKQIVSCRKQLKKLREQFDSLILGVNTGTNEVKTYIIKPNETKEDWKSLSTKIYKAKQEMQTNIKELQTKIITNNDMTVVLNQLDVGIQECKLLLKKKVEFVDFDKAVKRIEGRLNNFIIQVFQKEGNMSEYDAMIAKQPWFCLSCDGQLKNFTGKLSKTLVTQKLTGKKVNPQSHMVRRNENGRLPSVIK